HSQQPLDTSWQSVALATPLVTENAFDAFFKFPSAGTVILGSGYPDASLQPATLLEKAAQRAAKQSRTWARLPVEGLPELREWFARDLGGAARADQVLLVPGGQAALSTLFRALVPFGGPLVVESPSYFGALGIARAFGLRVVPVPHDDEGIRPDLLRAALASTGARVLYLQPAFSNPTGITLSESRRKEVLEIVRSANAFLIEDDYARDLVDGAPPVPLYREGDGHVIYVRSLTKSTAPGVRVGAIVAEGPVLGRLKTARAIDDWFLSGLLQATALELVSSPSFPGYVQKLVHTLRERRSRTVDTLRKHFPEAHLRRVPSGGFSLWLELPQGTDESAFVQAALEAGVQINPGAPWFAAEPSGPHLRLSIAGASAELLEEGVRRLGALFQRLQASSDLARDKPGRRRA
ncbi:MAG TPA: PLP-dependent aminotransferase family protein, partial [Polyangiaceae bacterium]|nr:PLP-dependent aminotransferase family protein [Polyangiaceae bacterium]